MNLFTVFDEETKKELLTAPLNHPNINYKWVERKIQINGISYQIIYIGEIIEDGNIKIIQFEKEDIGFPLMQISSFTVSASPSHEAIELPLAWRMRSM